MALPEAIYHAIVVLKRELENARVSRLKFEEGGNLYALIEKESPAALDRLRLIDHEISELEEAIAYLERERNAMLSG